MKRIALLLLLLPSPAHAVEVVTSIKPLHSLAATLMQNSGRDPILLVAGSASPHSFSLKPSQMKQLQQADLVFYIDDDFEQFLQKPLSASPARKLVMSALHHMTLHEPRSEHEHEHEEHEEHVDLHLWTSIANAKVMANAMTEALIKEDAKQAPLYKKNRDALLARLNNLDASLAARMKPLKEKRFVSFHDASQYFEKSYGLQSAGALTVHPERGLSAGHVSDIRAQIDKDHITCLFGEPQFDKATLAKLVNGTTTKTAQLDAEATELTPAPELYFQLMEGLAASFEGCLG